MSAHYPKAAAGHERLYRIWRKMRERCSNHRADSFKNYGARGIRVCSEWDDFVAFRDWALANGYGPSLSIERRDGNLNYTPANCTWATRLEQNRNRRNVRLAPDGRPYSEHATANGIGESTYRTRMSRGWDAAEAASAPVEQKFSTRTVSLSDEGKVVLS
jgi:hypothetical protein